MKRKGAGEFVCLPRKSQKPTGAIFVTSPLICIRQIRNMVLLWIASPVQRYSVSLVEGEKRTFNLQSTADSVIQVPLLPGGSWVSSSGRVSAPKRISPWSGENNGRTFYYQIDLWISSRVPTTEVYTAASSASRALSAVNRRRLSPDRQRQGEYVYPSE